MIRCERCKIEKSINEFLKPETNKDKYGYQNICLNCAMEVFDMSNIYIIEANGSYKIGESKHPEKRLKQLQTGNHCWLKLIKVYEHIYNAKDVEKLIHKRLDFCHLEGEWFRCDIERIYNIIDNTLNELKEQRAWYS